MTPAGTLVGTLDPRTWGCIDVNDGEFHVHVCDAQPGDVVRADQETDWSPLGNCDVPRYPNSPVAWRLGNTIALVPFDTSGGYPQYSVLADAADAADYAAALDRVDDPYEPVPEVVSKSAPYIAPDGPEPHATYQWKGTTTYLTWTCSCGTACKVEGAGFTYNVVCPNCRACFTCRSSVPAERVPLPEPK